MITPQEEVPELAEALGLKVPLYLKREDLHPLGSHKGRSIPYMIEQYARGGVSHFAISSSGNAALAAILYTKNYNARFPERPLELQVFVGKQINPAKLKILNAQAPTKYQISIHRTDTPKQEVHRLDKRGEAKSLRQATDPLALVGYQSLADEILELKPGAVFVPSSSGTTAQALAERGLSTYAVQPMSCHPISDLFDTERAGEIEPPLADAIVDRVAIRKNSLLKLLMSGYTVTNMEITAQIKLCKDILNIDISANSALAIAGLGRALKLGWRADSPVVALITGR